MLPYILAYLHKCVWRISSTAKCAMPDTCSPLFNHTDSDNALVSYLANTMENYRTLIVNFSFCLFINIIKFIQISPLYK